MNQQFTVNLFGITDVGVLRKSNEDNFVLCRNLSQKSWQGGNSTYSNTDFGLLLAVADGMGGTKGGAVASQLATDFVKKAFSQIKNIPESEFSAKEFLKKLVFDASHSIAQYAYDHPECKGMGTTLLLAWVVGDTAHIVWSGDSRAYLYREGKRFEPLTDDHSMVWKMVRRGVLTPEEARLHPESHIIHLEPPIAAKRPIAFVQ
jgi:serine/threonine protein phosphatase PrpC